MKCENCGSELQPKQKFCGNCGAPVKMRPVKSGEKSKNYGVDWVIVGWDENNVQELKLSEFAINY